MNKRSIILLCYECIIIPMAINETAKESSMKILKGVKVALKALVLDFD